MDIQLIATAKVASTAWSGPLVPGQVLWVRNEAAARHLVEHGVCKFPEAAPAPVPAEIARPKFFAAPMVGRSIALRALSARGVAFLSSASAAALLSAQRV